MRRRYAVLLPVLLLLAGQGRAGTEAANVASVAARLHESIARCWNVPTELPDHVAPVRVKVSLTPSGHLASPPAIAGPMGADAATKSFAASALRAIVRCAPFTGLDALAPYEEWKTLSVTFRPPEF